MKAATRQPTAAEQAAVRQALDCGCKVDTSVITFFGKKRTTNVVKQEQIPSSAAPPEPMLSQTNLPEGPLPSSLKIPRQNEEMVEDDEKFC
jgi:hypothetical protein